MAKIYTTLSFLMMMILSPALHAQDLVHYWNFNDNSSVTALTTPTQSAVAGASITAIAGGISAIDAAGGTGQNFNLLNLNAQNGDVSGTHLRFNDPIGGQLEFAIPTTGFQNIVVNFATRRSGSGAGNQLWSYASDGINFVPFVTIVPNNGDPSLVTLDFTSISDANDNPNFKLRVAFEQGDGGIAGNNRFDNFTVRGNATGGDVTPPFAITSPSDSAVNVPVDVSISISFTENVRLANGTAIDNSNVDAVVELRKGGPTGPSVPFDAFFAPNTITITPTADLANNQLYYVMLLADSVQDLSGNSIGNTTGTTFTTVAIQNILQPGDLAFVGYRMSATAAEDEIAFVTLTDIGDGTFINFTDAKYTTNPQPQCAGGFVWTVDADTCLPAGTVVTMQTSALVSSNGTLTGTGFGLSSGGDQVIVYTGTAAAPNYITALTSNGWVTANTECTGSVSILPAGLTDGISALNTSTSPGNVAGVTANAFYNGTQTGSYEALRMSIFNPANWTTSAANTDPQAWPTWDFPQAVRVQSVAVTSSTTLQVTFSEAVDATSAGTLGNYTGIGGLVSVNVSGLFATLTFSAPFTVGTSYELVINNILGSDGLTSGCAYTFDFDGTLATQTFEKGNFGLTLYPNPSGHGIVTMSKAADVEIFDFTGKIIYSAKNATTFDTSAFSDGLYFVKTQNGTKKLIVR